MDDQISSTTPSYDVHHDDEGEFRAEKQANSLMDEDFSSSEAQAHVPEVEGILDLAGGAKDALERHRSTMPRKEEPLLDFGEPEPEPSSIIKPEPEAPKPAPISSFGDASPKQAKPEEKEEKPTVAPYKCNSSCSSHSLSSAPADEETRPQETSWFQPCINYASSC